MSDFLYQHQADAVRKLKCGSVLVGGVGSGKSRTALTYYHLLEGGRLDDPKSGFMPMHNPPRDLIIICPARKRDSLEWHGELTAFLLSTEAEYHMYSNNPVIVDSWNNIKKYEDVKNSVFILDEQRLVGSGAWVKSFYKIAKNNHWILLSATPADTPMDLIPVFVANGFYKNKTEFIREHVRYKTYLKFPVVDSFMRVRKIDELKNRIFVEMPFKRHTVQNHKDVYLDYDEEKYRFVMKNRWDPWKEEPLANAGALCYCLRKVVNKSPSRAAELLQIYEEKKKVIVFYNFNYELDDLIYLCEAFHIPFSQYNGHIHQPIPEGDNWIYICQFTSSAESWNCVSTDTIVFYSQNYSYRIMTQAAGRIDRMNTPYTDLYYYHFKSRASIDRSIGLALKQKKKFNEKKFVGGFTK